MGTPHRIPPATRLKFEQLAHRICDLACLDYADYPLRAHEIVSHLEERWREGVDGDLNDDAAEIRAVKLFGIPTQVAKALRRPILYRLLCYRRYMAERLLVFLGSYVCLSWLSIVESSFRSYLQGREVPLFTIIFPDSYWFFVTGLGSFGVGIAATAAVILIRWQPMTENRWILRILSVRQVAAILPLVASLHLAAASPYIVYRAWTQYVDVQGYSLYFAITLLSTVLAWLGAVCLLCEWLNLPARLNRRRNRSAPVGMAVS